MATLEKINLIKLKRLKSEGQKITALTAYDYTFATILDNAGIEIILVGDSVAQVVHGHENTLPINLDTMILHAQAVKRAVKKSFIVVDLPFGSYQNSQQGLSSATRIMKECGADAIKLEGGAEIKDTINIIVNAGIPVMGHLGLQPQSVNQYGGYGVRGTSVTEATQIYKDAQMLQELGCFAIVLEKIPAVLTKKISNKLNIITIGIGAGKHCDGQILVINDMLGMNPNFKPRFVRTYTQLYEHISEATKLYINDVKKNNFPNEKEQY